MAKVKLTKGELKRQRDGLRQFRRYLPTLQLKKQQLQLEILHWNALLDDTLKLEDSKKLSIMAWAELLAELGIPWDKWLMPEKIVTENKNIAGVDLLVFKRVEFSFVEYDLFLMPLWVDSAIDFLRELVGLRQEVEVIKRAIDTLKRELHTTTQRVNLFEKVKIPDALESIRRIKIYIGDQMANAVGRCKIAKRKIEEFEYSEAAV